ncbi:SHD1 domain-containing protein [Stieleria sp. ICT_E10.1]|uniref:SHD1 domain-containing protein n=1 Tax=Stieleria sedimenti TaxID=2976331 RepID=UPI00217FD57B|nr:SHD1 domain-containing protein [Stieleria sedimenti]MCS7469932.1 SHD1 domain-containing protein [Stieleria sedimenti]
MRTRHLRDCVFVVTFTVCIALLVSPGRADEPRTWTDSTGKFRVTASLIQVQDEVVFLKTDTGKTLKIPVARLSQADRDFLNAGENPFEMVDAEPSPRVRVPAAPANTGNPSMSAWTHPPAINWDSVPTMDPGFGESQWNYTPPVNNALPFETKAASLPAKANFFEGMRRLQINPLAARCVAGYTWTFSTPKPLSRISLVDLPSGKAINSEPVECNMCPLTVLNDGKTVLMQGTGGDRDGFETGDQLQLWTLTGTKVTRSGIWVPFPADKKAFGKTTHARPIKAVPIANNLLILLSDSGHLACFDLATLNPIWHARLSQNFAVTCTTDRQQMFVLDEHTLMLVDPLTGQAKGSMQLEGKPRLGWTKMQLNESGDQMLISFVNNLRIMDLKTGETIDEYSREGGAPIAPNGLSYPAPDYALLDNHLLLHIPSRITVCDYKDAAVITSVGGTEFVGLLSDGGGLIVPTSIPHPKATEVLRQAVDDPSVFLIHPGVNVAMDVSGVPDKYRAEVEQNLKNAISKAGYKLSNGAAIKIKAAISGPKNEAVSYIARGAYVAKVYQSTLTIESDGTKAWSRSGSNIPMMLQTKRGQSIQEKLDELGKRPNTSFFETVALPKLLQAPTKSSSGNTQNALLVSKFTLRGLVDSE